MADTRLILHVKGTESQTSELPREVVRDGVWQGKIAQSQLIWRPAENTWKPIRELPELIPPVEHLILHVKGTEAETRQLPRPAVREAISKGEIKHSQLIWRPSENAWKQVRELPDLLPSQKLAPAPVRARPMPTPAIAEEIIPESPHGPVGRAIAATPRVAEKVPTARPQPRIAAVASAGGSLPTAAGPPKIRVPSIATPVAVPRATPVAVVPRVRVATLDEPQPESVAQETSVATPVEETQAETAVPVVVVPRVRVATIAPTIVAEETPIAAPVEEPQAESVAPVSVVPRVRVATITPTIVAAETPVATPVEEPQAEPVARVAVVPRVRAATIALAVITEEAPVAAQVEEAQDGSVAPVADFPRVSAATIALAVVAEEAPVAAPVEEAQYGSVAPLTFVPRVCVATNVPTVVAEEALVAAPVEEPKAEQVAPNPVAAESMPAHVSAEAPRVHPAPVAAAPAKIRVPSIAAPVAKIEAPVEALVEVPQVQPKPEVMSIPKVRVAAVAKPITAPVETAPSIRLDVITAPSPEPAPVKRNFKVKEDDAAHPLKWVCIGMGILVSLLLGVNYFLVDSPLVSKLSATEFSGEAVHGHLAAFVQPNVVIIHVRQSKSITKENFTQFLVALARSTPDNPITNVTFSRVALTSEWTAQFSFSGFDWKKLAEMGGESEAERKEFLMDRLSNASGEPLMPESTLGDEARVAKREKAWQGFVDSFAAKS